jgi:hypothetical protein
LVTLCDSLLNHQSTTMPDDPKNRGPRDAQRINVNEDYELRYWTEKFGVSAQELKGALAKVGPMVEDVRKELQK